MRLGRWLAVALEIELSANILRAAVAPTWPEIGQVGAVVVLRTVLNFILQQQEINKAEARAAPGKRVAPRLCRDRRAVRFLGMDWAGLTPGNGHRLLESVAFIAIVVLAGRGLRALAGVMCSRSAQGGVQIRFWSRQGISLLTADVLVLGILSIWFSDPARLASAFGLVLAGLAFALQKVVTSIAGYLVILRGNTFAVGDRISMGGVRGDVMRLDFIQITIMETGRPPADDTGARRWCIAASSLDGSSASPTARSSPNRVQLHSGLSLHLGGVGDPAPHRGRSQGRRNHPAGTGPHALQPGRQHRR